MNKICNILGVHFNNVNYSEAVNILLSFLKKEKTHMVFTPNPEMVMRAKKDKELKKILNSADLVVPDGIGIVIASKINGKRLKERVAGYDLVQKLFKEIKNTNYTVYFLGSSPGIAKTAKENMEKKYSGIKITGVQDGYFDKNKEKIIIDEIKNLRPDILLVGLGVPRQEKWIYQNKNNLPVKISIGVGGSFDVMSGNVKRAPDIFLKLGLEWFYRLLQQPWRFIRMLQLPLFIIEVFIAKIKGE